MHATQLLLWGIVAHLIADWLLQNDWMATYKTDLRHRAAWVHGGIHFVAMLLVFPFVVAALLALSHILIDTRKPLEWWRNIFQQTRSGPAFASFAMWEDQTLHIGLIALAALLVARPG